MENTNSIPRYFYNPESDLLKVFTNSSASNYYEEISDNIYFDFDDATDDFIGLVVYAFSKISKQDLITTTKNKIDLSHILYEIEQGIYQN